MVFLNILLLVEDIAVAAALLGEIWLRTLPYRLSNTQDELMASVMPMTFIFSIAAVLCGFLSLVVMRFLARKKDGAISEWKRKQAWITLILAVFSTIASLTFVGIHTW